MPHQSINRVERVDLSRTEFIALAATLMSVVAMATDIMLPTLPEIARSFQGVVDNELQLIITYFSVGFGLGHLLFGPLCDRFGRRAILIPALVIYSVMPVLGLFSQDFDQFLWARALQGVAAGGVRVGVLALVRDCFAGRDMAKVMSFVYMVFMIIPIIAPALGQVLTDWFFWQALFILLSVFGVLVIFWLSMRLKESIHEEHRTPISVGGILSNMKAIVTNRIALGYTLAATAFIGALFTMLNISQQVFVDLYGLGKYFPLVFAFIAATMSLSAVTNGKLVGRFGMRKMAHTALFAFCIFGGLLYVWSLIATPPLAATILLLSAAMFCFGIITPNFNAMAMEPLGSIAGQAAALMGFTTFTGGALIGMLVGQNFDGTMKPVASGFFILGVCSLICVLWVERGRLFQNPQN